MVCRLRFYAAQNPSCGGAIALIDQGPPLNGDEAMTESSRSTPCEKNEIATAPKQEYQSPELFDLGKSTAIIQQYPAGQQKDYTNQWFNP